MIDITTQIRIQNHADYWYTAEMSPHEERWLCYTDVWKKDPQQPYDL
jgi:hypothetical protein